MKILSIFACLFVVGCTPTPDPTNDAGATHGTASNFGDCTAPVDLRLDPNDSRKAKLLADVTYTDSKGYGWVAPKGHVVDGASIPRAFWRVIGGPWEGKYRFASVIHDVACDKKTRTSDDAAKMFYEAMLCSKVSKRKAKVMYYAVHKFGPKWGSSASGRNRRTRGIELALPSASMSPAARPATEEDVKRAFDFVDTADPTLEQIEAEASKR